MRQLTAAMAIVAVIGSTVTTVSAAGFNHDPGSPNGPDYWGQLLPADRTCGAILAVGGPFVETGKKQSPIDIVNPVKTRSLRRLNFRYREISLKVENNGHVIEVPDNSSVLTVGSERYRLKQFHFHTRSEHTINGADAAMEVHFVHSNALGDLAVVGVLMDAVPQGNPAVDKIFSYAPLVANQANEPANEVINARELLPRSRKHYYTYSGSLTTPSVPMTVRHFRSAEIL